MREIIIPKLIIHTLREREGERERERNKLAPLVQ